MFGKIFTHPMRPFFLLSALCVIFTCAVFWLEVDFVSYHKFAFLALVLPCAYAGFLLTAVPDWARFFGNLTPHAFILFGFFMAAFVSGFINLSVAYGFAGAFWAYLFGFCVFLLARDKNDKNFSVLGVLFGFCALNFAYAFNGDDKFLLAQIHLNVAAIVVVSYRVSIVIAKEALNANALFDYVFVPSFVRKNLSLLSLCVLIFALIFNASSQILGYVCIGVCLMMFARLYELHYTALLRRHYVLFYYAILLCLAAGYLLLVASYFGFDYQSSAIHLITICAILGAIMLIFNIAGLRHSGQILIFSNLAKISFVFVLLAGIFRAFVQNFYIALPSILLALSFILWAVKYFSIFRDNDFSKDPE